jgi:hypothetical protein
VKQNVVGHVSFYTPTDSFKKTVMKRLSASKPSDLYVVACGDTGHHLKELG